MDQRLSLISLGVTDLARSRHFYVEGLGWRPSSSSNDEIVFIQLNGFALGLYGHDDLASDANVEANRSSFRGFTLAYNGRDRDEVDRVLALALKAGAKITKPASETFWGGYSGYFADPDGFLWEVAHNPGVTITARNQTVFSD